MAERLAALSMPTGADLGRVVAVIQARMGSSRLRGKVLMDLGGRPLLSAMLARVRRARRLDSIVVATTESPVDDPVCALCERLGIATFRGSENDVLARMFGAAREFGAGTVVRLTADCPMIDPCLIDEAVAMMASGRWDYVSNAMRRTYPDGLDVEVMSEAALAEANRCASHAYLREHVTPYINRNRPDLGCGEFRIGDLIFGADFGHLRWTVDTATDLDRVRELVGMLPEGFTWLQALAEATKRPHLLGYDPSR